jgi:hypothetical protein
MFGLISAGVSLAGLGMSAIQAVQEGRRMKEAQAKSNAALQGYKNIQEQSALASLQAPDISSLQFDRTQRAMSQGVDALSQTGAEGAIGGVTNLVQAGQEANLQAAQQQGEINAQTDLLKANEQSRIGQDAVRRQEEAAGYEIGQANTQFNTASANRNAAISGMVGAATAGIGAAAGDFDPATGRYKYKKDKVGEVSADAFKKAYSNPVANYSGSVTSNYGAPVVGASNLAGNYLWNAGTPAGLGGYN